jgi:hypothetical protein
MAQNGGARPGAGRPKGSKSLKVAAKHTVERAAAALEEAGIISAETAKLKPLDILIKVMLYAYETRQWDRAATYAKEAAPYCHAKMSSVDLNATIKKDVSAMSDDEILSLLTKHNAKLPTSDQPSVTVN